MKYDSAIDTKKHIERVQDLIAFVSNELLERGKKHDASKLGRKEKPYFDKFTPKLKQTTYGSQEYFSFFKELNIALSHHYRKNCHHPEHYSNGIDGFDLFDLVEMFLDWKAATERHDDGDIIKSIHFNQKRFGYSDQILNIFENTAKRYFKYI